jgi:DNA-directed RNA polymerase specialized sigma24 family protein
MLGSTGEADDAVQEAWVRLNRSDTSTIENLDGWLTPVVSRVSLDMLLPTPNPDVIHKAVADGAVLLSTRDEVYYGLNADRDAMPDVDVLAQCLGDELAELLETVR